MNAAEDPVSAQMRARGVCVSGHRPEKLPEGNSLRLLKSMLYGALQQAADEGYLYFYTGLSRGVDMWAADSIRLLRMEYPQIRSIGVMPYRGFGDGRKQEELYLYSNIIHSMDEVICLSEHYRSGCYRKRNQYLVDHSSLLIAVADNMHSGTGQTIRMAERAGLTVRRIPVIDRKENRENL